MHVHALYVLIDVICHLVFRQLPHDFLSTVDRILLHLTTLSSNLASPNQLRYY